MLAPCYLVHGGEPQQTEEFVAWISHQAAKDSYNKIVVFDIHTLLDWDELLNKCQNLDLFAERTLLEVRLHSETVSKHGNIILEQVLLQQDPNFCILIRAPKLKAQTLNSSWVKHIQHKGKVFTAKAIPVHLWPNWLAKRLATAGFTPSAQALDLIASCYEGNLLAAMQFINKIKTVLTPGNLSVEQIQPFIDHNNQYSIFELTNAAFSGNVTRMLQIFNNLKATGVEPLLLLWALTREIRAKTMPNSQQKLLLRKAKTVDWIVKGLQAGNAWDELLSMCLIISGKETLTMEDLYL